MPPHSQISELLAQSGWARTLARQLVRDAHSADDLVQRAWLAAIEHPPAAAVPPRRWIAAVLRNFARQDARADLRRAEREVGHARPDSHRDAAIEGIELQEMLLAHLRELPESSRSALYARYFEGLAPREIARRAGVPVKTVKTRLARGLEELRARFDRQHGGDRAAWMALLIPLIEPPLPPLAPVAPLAKAVSSAPLGALLVDLKLKIALAVVATAVVVVTALQFASTEPAHPGTSSVEAASAPDVASATPPSAPAPAEERSAIAQEPASAEVAAPANVPAPALERRGRVFDLENHAVTGVHVVVEPMFGGVAPSLAAGFHGPRREIRTDAEGGFPIRAGLDHHRLLVEDERWVTVFRAHVLPQASFEPTIFVAPRRELGGLVVDPNGEPIAGATLEVRIDESVKRNLERRLDSAYRVNFEAKSDALGRFEIRDAPACAGKIHAEAIGCAAVDLDPPVGPDLDLRIVLSPLAERHAVVRGIVVDAQRKPIEKALVAAGGMTHETGADGRFEFDLESLLNGESFEKGEDGVFRAKYDRRHLRAAKPDLLPDEVELPEFAELRRDPEPREFTLVLQGEPLSIRGRVVDADGRPVTSAEVRVLDERRFGAMWNRVGEVSYTNDVTFEEILRGGAGYSTVGVDEDGKFEMRGLLRRDYELAAVDPQTLRYATRARIAAGSEGVAIELPAAAALERVAGRVVSRAGDPVAGVSVHVGHTHTANGIPDFVRDVTTDDAGRFDLGPLDASALRLQLTGPAIFFEMAWAPPKDAKLDELEIAVSRRFSVRIELGVPDRADGFKLVDAKGEPVQLIQFEGPVMMLAEQGKIAAGRSEIYAAEETARTLVLFKADAEVARMPVHFDSSEVTVLRD
jgi:RNA polymerase sigma-70 factor (ECF subfamily)